APLGRPVHWGDIGATCRKSARDCVGESLMAVLVSFMLLPMTNSPPSSMFYRPRLGAAADKGLLLVARCNLCRRSRAYLASDLLQIYHRDTFLDDLFGGRCPRCDRSDFW